MKTIKKVVLFSLLAASMTSCAGVYRSLDINCEDDRGSNKNEGIHFDIDTSCKED